MDDPSTGWPTWRVAMHEALYGQHGFYRVERPGSHFRTSVHTSPLFAGAIARLVAEVHDRLAAESRFDVVDLGAGEGELLVTLAELLPQTVRLIGVELRARPRHLSERIEWSREVPRETRGLLIANEWLDNVPLDIAEVDSQGRPRLVHVEPSTGSERLGDVVSGPEAHWLRRHWRLDGADQGTRAEIGLSRDAAWSALVSTLRAGVAVAIDYHHLRDQRPPLGTLTGFRDGREVRPMPNGSCDLTAHVALDACAAAVEELDAPVTTTLRSQRDSLRSLGVRGTLPSRETAATDPGSYLRGLVDASEAAALTDPGGLGAFGWLAHSKGLPMPSSLGG